jgi:hypothetical protein
MELYLYCFYTPPWRVSQTLGQLCIVFIVLVLFVFYFINAACCIKYSSHWLCVLILAFIVEISNSLLLVGGLKFKA